MTKKYAKKTRFSIDEKIENSKFNYCKNLKWFLIAPIMICLIGLVLFFTVGFNLGIDFTGGSIMTVYLDKTGNYISETVDTSTKNEIVKVNKDINKVEAKINGILKKHGGLQITTIQETTIDVSELGITKGDAVIFRYQNNNELDSAEIEAINNEIRFELLKSFGFIANDITIEDYEAETNVDLIKNGGVTTASASAELVMKSFIALLVAVALILVYVAFRFEFTSGLAAILALFHDLLVTSSIMLICRVQINVAFIAALITILGYSINNTIIIFDRMRERLKSLNQTNEKVDNVSVANSSVKGTMMRSILTTLTTFVMIFMITIIGVSDIKEFAFPIMIGIIAGFYSSVFVTPGLWAIAYKPKKRKKNKKTETTASVEENVIIEDAEEEPVEA